MEENRAVCDLLDEVSLKKLLFLIPKCELHSHLSGSILPSLLSDLIESSCVTIEESEKECISLQNWQHVLEYFSLIHKVTSELGVVRRVTIEAIDRYFEENVYYVEFRVGLRRIPTKRDHLNEIIDTIISHTDEIKKNSSNGIVVRLLLSIARHGDLSSCASETIDLAIEYFKDQSKGKGIIVGVELGGNPFKGDFSKDAAPLMDRARSAGLRVALHFAENGKNLKEHHEMLDFQPNRLGHAVFVDSSGLSHLIQSKIPVEICLQCHNQFFQVPYDQNVFHQLWSNGHPLSLCCDNRGIFGCLTDEYLIASKTFCLTAEELKKLVLQAFDYGADSPDSLQLLRNAAEREIDNLFSEFLS